MLSTGAFQALLATVKPLPLPDRTVQVRLVNKGPNAIYLAPTVAGCTTADGFEVAAGGSLTLDKGPNDLLFVRAATADQVSPADIRWLAISVA